MFTFTLQSVLNYRQAMEEKLLCKFSEEQKRLAGEQKILENLRREKALLVEGLKGESRPFFNAADLSVCLAYLETVKQKETAQEEVVSEVLVRTMEKREALINAVKDRKIIDTLKEHQLQAYKTGKAAVEQKAADEAAVMRFVRREK